jgi:hypothetical protein
MRGAFLIVGLIILASQAASADPTRDEVMSGAARCEGIADNRAWLDCFYGSAQPMRSLLNLPPAPIAQIRLVPPPGAAYTARPGMTTASAAAPRQKSGGFWSDVLGSTKPTVTNMPMASYSIGPNRLFTVTLQNGEVYAQDAADMVFAKWNKPPASYRVTIEPLADKFTLKVKGESGVVFHVVRR